LSLLENKFKDKIKVVILCAGEGKRLKEITRTRPKPLLRIKALDNEPILYNTIKQLIDLGIKRIGIVVGHLGNMINNFIVKIQQSNKSLYSKISVINSKNEYKRGPLHSFLSITNVPGFFISESIYVLIPGDIIFDFGLLKEIFSLILKSKKEINDAPFFFYRKINQKILKELRTKKKLISLVEIKQIEQYNILIKIHQVKLKSILYNFNLMQTIPVCVLNYKYINKILSLKKKNFFKTIWETINYLISKGDKIYAFEVANNLRFHDIDNEHDLRYIHKKKEDNRRSD